jgi:methylmalonyl-CoA/ethylmalonyl-CoA epimerase
LAGSNETGLNPDQIGILVEDLEPALERYAGMFAGSKWRIWTYGPQMVPKLTYRGAPSSYEMRLALSDTTPQLELIQPLRGPSIYEEWIQAHGYGRGQARSRPARATSCSSRGCFSD